MSELPSFDIRFDTAVKIGTAELYGFVLYFHDEADYWRWANGLSFKLINHWIKSAPQPRYK